MFLIGSVMDYREERLFSGFVFENPNETGRCGCGESFYGQLGRIAAKTAIAGPLISRFIEI